MDKIDEAKIILNDLGMPKAQQNDISALTLLALCSIKENSSWDEASRSSQTVTKSIMKFIKDHYSREYAPNTRETFRRQVLHQFFQGGIVDYNPDNPSLPTNSPYAHYAMTDEAIDVVRNFGTRKYKKKVNDFRKKHGVLVDIYQKKKENVKSIPVTLPDGTRLDLSPGKHNQVQLAVINDFVPRFVKKPKILYFGDTAQKNLFLDNETFSKMRIAITEHDKLPDIVILDGQRKWLFLVEVVTSHGPMNPKRIFELKKMFGNYSHGIVYVSAFPDFSEFRQHSKDISWETEVWLADSPDHMIHYNGDRFMGPR